MSISQTKVEESKQMTVSPGLEGYQQPKAPTVISYDPKDKNSFAWGAQQHKHPRIEGIKLLLDSEQEMPIYVPASNTAAQLERLGKPAVEVAADYMAAIYTHAMSKIESKMPIEYFRMCKRKFEVSVPAVWSDKAKDITREVSILFEALSVAKQTHYRLLIKLASIQSHLSKSLKPQRFTLSTSFREKH